MKKIIYKSLDAVKNIYKKFPISLGLCTLVCFFLAIVIDTTWINEKTTERILIGMTILISETAIIDTKCDKFDKRKMLLLILSIIPAVVFTKYIFESEPIQKFVVSYCITCLLTTLYLLFKNSNKSFGEYITKAFINLLKLGVISSFITTGIIVISLMFSALIFEFDSLLFRLIFIFLGIYYIPTFVNSFVDLEEEYPKFLCNIINYVLFGIMMILYTLVYIYLLKVLFTGIPSNQIYAIVTVIFIGSMFTWPMVSYIKDNKVNKIAPYLFIPFILLQSYSIIVRIINYGVTPQRYIGVVFVMIEILYIVFYLIKKDYAINILLVIVASIIVGLNIPYINMIDVSNESQYKRLNIYNEKKNLTNDDKKKIKAAFLYLNSSDEGKEYIDKALSKKDIQKILNYQTDKRTNENYIYFNKIQDFYNVKGYSYFESVSVSKYDVNKDIKEIFSNLSFGNNKINIYDAVMDYIENKDDESYLKNNNEIIIDENTKVVFDSFMLNLVDDIVDYYELDGYLIYD